MGMSRRDIEWDWTFAANRAWFAIMSNKQKRSVLGEISQDLKARIFVQISHLAELSKNQLKAAWVDEYRKDPPKSLSCDLVLRTLVWRLQDNAFGGHDHATVKLLEGVVPEGSVAPTFESIL